MKASYYGTITSPKYAVHHVLRFCRGDILPLWVYKTSCSICNIPYPSHVRCPSSRRSSKPMGIALTWLGMICLYREAVGNSVHGEILKAPFLKNTVRSLDNRQLFEITVRLKSKSITVHVSHFVLNRLVNHAEPKELFLLRRSWRHHWCPLLL